MGKFTFNAQPVAATKVYVFCSGVLLIIKISGSRKIMKIRQKNTKKNIFKKLQKFNDVIFQIQKLNI